jgi:adenylate kinase family enzyme
VALVGPTGAGKSTFAGLIPQRGAEHAPDGRRTRPRQQVDQRRVRAAPACC